MRSLPVLTPPSPPKAAPLTAPRTVRLSLTDRCDLACVYCRPHRHDGYVEKRLDFASWKVMTQGLIDAGIRRVRLTGGEPLLHPDVVAMVRHLGTLPLDDLALTTNATRLAGLAPALREAGLLRLTISMDSLDPARFFRMTRGGSLRDVLSGVDAAMRAGFDELKLNTVVLAGENDDEVEALTLWAWERGITPRFLEIMAIGEGAHVQDRLVSGQEVRSRLLHLLSDAPAERDPDRGPAKYVTARHDPSRRVGFITGTSDTFCATCDRLRVASDGMLRPCLAMNSGVSAAAEARAGDARGVERAIHAAWEEKPDGETWKGCTEETAAAVSIRSIGG